MKVTAELAHLTGRDEAPEVPTTVPGLQLSAQ